MSHSLDWLTQALEQLDELHLRRSLRTFAGARAAVLRHQGRELVNFSSNDYLGLAADPRLAEAATQAAATHGWGAGASALVTGHTDWHAALEAELAAFEHTKAALLFSTGFAANSGTIPAIVGAEDSIFSDEHNHASLIDGCRLSRAQVHIYRHNDVGHLAELLSASHGRGRRLIVTDSVFSMHGDVAPLVELVQLAEQYEAMLLVDEAHATGVFGTSGSGMCEQLGVAERVPIRIGTLSKALGASGGFVAGSQQLIDWLTNRARSFVFSTAMPAATCAAAVAALQIVKQEPERRERVRNNAATLRAKLLELGCDLGTSTSQIVPVIIGNPETTMRLSSQLYEAGFLVPGIRPPSVPAGQSLLRVSLSAAHTPEMLDRLAAAVCRFLGR